jgi:hypothetical protein
VNQNPSRPFGLPVDTRLPVDRIAIRFVRDFTIQPDPHPTRHDWWIVENSQFNAAFRNAEAAEASE